MGKKKAREQRNIEHPRSNRNDLLMSNGTKPEASDTKTAPEVPTLRKVSGKEYEQELEKLEIELAKLQEWIKTKGLKIVVVFEGRDTAGKGGMIKAITNRLNPRMVRTVALGIPTEREKTQWYFQRYIAHMPAAGEMVLFDRSWYNRAGVEPVMGFCTDQQYWDFLRACPGFEKSLVDSGILLIKYWLDITAEVQEERFQERLKDERKKWKLSPMDLETRKRFDEYTRARDLMFEHTSTEYAPWYIVDSNHQKTARLNGISHLLNMIPYEDLIPEPEKLPTRKKAKPHAIPQLPNVFQVPQVFPKG